MITSPAIDVLQREIDETDQLISELTESLKAAKAKHKSLAAALAVLTGRPVSAATFRDTIPSGPTLKEQILKLLAPDGMGLAPAEIANLLTESGRETGNTTVSSTLSRMIKEGIVVKRSGKWFLPQENKSQHAISNGLPSATSKHAVLAPVQSSDWAGKVAQDLSSPQQNPAPAGAGQAETGSAAGTSGVPNPNQWPPSQ